MATSDESNTVLICGAGIAGLTLAWWLARDGWAVTVVEIAPSLRDEGYMIDFFGSGYDVAEQMGILPQLDEVSYSFSGIVNVDSDGDEVSTIDYELFKRLNDGDLLSLMRGDLERVLYDTLPETVEIRYSLTVESVSQDRTGVDVGLSDGTTERVALLVGADGIHSQVRELVFGDEATFLRYLGYQTAAYIFEDDAVRAALDGEFLNLAAENRMAGFYPIRDGKVAAWFAHREPSEEVPTSPCDGLRTKYEAMGWLVPDVLAHCDELENVYYDKVAQVEMNRWTDGRVTLVGDACYAVSLLAGQGASMAMGGAYILADKLRETSTVEDGLERYEAELKPEIERKQAYGRRTANILIPPTKWHIALRNLFFNLSQLPGMYWVLRPILAGTDSVLRE